jgi:hypothetical protein
MYLPVLIGLIYTYNLKSVFVIPDSLSIIPNYYAIDVDSICDEEATGAILTRAVMHIM